MKGLIFTYVMCYGGSVVALVKPWYGLLAYVCFAIIKPASLWDWSVPPGNYSRIIALSLLLGWLLHGLGNWKLGAARGILIALMGLWVWMLLGGLLADNPSVCFTALEALSKIFLPVVVGLTLVSTTSQIMSLAWTIVLSQGYLAFEFNLQYLKHTFNPEEFAFAGLDNNGIGITMCSSLGLAYFLGLASRPLWAKAIAWGFGILMTHFVLFSLSRGAMLALGVTFAVAFVVMPKRPVHWATFAAAAIVTLVLAGPSVQKEFFSSFDNRDRLDNSASSRLDNWLICIAMMKDRPVFGVGLDHFPLMVDGYLGGTGIASSRLVRAGREAHTLWLQLGAELGIPGLLFLLSFYGGCALKLWPIARKPHRYPHLDPATLSIARGVIASLAGFAVSAQFVTIEGVELPYYVALLGASLLKVQSTAVSLRGQPTVEHEVPLSGSLGNRHAF
ncbi:MAG TPA: O-antigen ligase family protein [Gemmataceae bacterium]|nr:O-antigen ligase family protein [Pirellulales bacterium]HZZ78377.1 O-antigen ligase family protein [Gemmataceae bacterium]